MYLDFCSHRSSECGEWHYRLVGLVGYIVPEGSHLWIRQILFGFHSSFTGKLDSEFIVKASLH